MESNKLEKANNELVNEVINPWSERGIANVKKCFAPSLTNEEFKIFIGLGKSLGANPFTREIWAVKYGSGSASIFCGRDFYRRKAQEQPDYDGHIVNAIYENDSFQIKGGEPEHIVNSFKNRGNLIGSFCSVYKKGIRVPYFVTVRLDEYNKGQSNWKTMPETMIKKVSEAQALRGAYQGIFRGTYDESEKDVIEASSETLPESHEKDYAFNLIRTSAYDEYQKDEFIQELEDESLTYNRLNEIVNNLKMNQLSKMDGNYNQGDINKQIDLKDGD